MELAHIFQTIEETQFLKKLSSQDRLFLVGEADTLEYIKNFFNDLKQFDNNYYYNLSNYNLANIPVIAQDLNNYQAIIILSLKNEASIFRKSDKRLINLRLISLF